MRFKWSSLVSRCRGLWAVLLLAVLLPLAILATPPDPSYPQWWLDSNLVASQPPATSNTTAYNAWVQQNYTPANLGQLKNFAAQANSYLQNWLGSDSNTTIQSDLSAINSTVAGFSTNATLNYSPVNLGQLKNVAKPIYDLLNDIGYNTTAQLNYLMYGNISATTWPYSYPWNPSTAYAVNYEPVNLGQLKLVFSFDLTGFSGPLSSNFGSYAADFPSIWLLSQGLSPYGTTGLGSGLSSYSAVYDEYGASRGHDPESTDNATVGLLVFTDLQ